jgi:hypothetical protein
MNPISKHIISLLKKYPRIGQFDEEERQRRQENAKNSIAAASSDIKKAAIAYAEFDANLTTLAKTTAKTTMAIAGAMGEWQKMAKEMQDLSEDVNVLAQRNKNLQKEFGLTIEQAGKMGYKMDDLAISMKTSREQIEKNSKAIKGLAYGVNSLDESLQQVAQYYGTTRRLSEEATQGLMAFNASMTKKGTTAEVEKQAVMFDYIAQKIEEQTQISGAAYEVQKGIGEAAAGTRLTFKKYPGQLGLAVIKLKQMGLELADLEAVGETLLNIESSVGEELNYQLLTGRRLVGNEQSSAKMKGKSLTNLYREQYLRGQANDAAETLNQIIMQEGDILENNKLARDQLQKTLGVEAGKLDQLIEKRKLLSQIQKDKNINIDLNLSGEKLEQALKDAKVDTQDIAKIMENENRDLRDPATRTAEYLGSIEAKGIKLRAGTEDEAVKMIKDAQTAMNDAIKEFGLVSNAEFLTFTNSLTTLGETQIQRKTRAADNEFKTAFTDLLNGVGGLTAVITTTVDQLLGNTGTANLIINGQEVQTMTVENASFNTAVPANDAVMVNDGMVSFNPRDKFRRINDGMTLAGTNVGGLDRYAAQMEKRDRNFQQSMHSLFTTFVAQIKTAVESANLIVKTDNTFGSTSLNPTPRYGG